ncbi:MAG: UDP-N-acetylglucosamine 2-epimerase (non-hydrolyzing) [Desulfitobacteriaceae bacterium]|nr:UDP-N-acetylglucosamine 2-epimerase (non-hydrolyzing) [Desulfitobacteriaceae bacterium]MDI6880232.1 UDP-N-acetylglucosamine 2-epimerase (non-hydrolyzing) [Desulfitobacteriaceae bacterium]MDI6915574.1 UDP-N-acetylglucosamine 2-epimerase (non-hydrolyzing) [Desulfitobacteriaceae bacterium]
MKVLTVLGTRPEIIRLSRVIPRLDSMCQHVLVHTGQNFEPTLNSIFFEELGLRAPDYILKGQAATPMEQVGRILSECEPILYSEQPDRLLILGDTNSALTAIAAKRLGIPVYHMEAGNRCFDDRVPEEVNRRIVDHCSDVLLPYSERSRANLLREGIEGRRIFVTGNPILEVLTHYADQIGRSQALERLGLSRGQYLLVTLHRAENVDDPERLNRYIMAFQQLHKKYKLPLIGSLHPHTRSQLAKQGKDLAGSGVRALEPLGLFDFVHLQRNALCVLSDSGTVQEECSIFKIPNVTLRDVTERPETVEAGSNIIAGSAPAAIVNAVQTVLSLGCDWQPPPEYLVPDVSGKIVRILLSVYGQAGASGDTSLGRMGE